MKILTLNCQKAYQPELKEFFKHILRNADYDFLLLQEASDEVEEIVNSSPNYALLRPGSSHVAVLYRRQFKLERSSFTPAPGKNPDMEFGITMGVFKVPELEQELLVGSLRLHPDAHFIRRARTLRAYKKAVLDMGPLPAIIGGDFNSGLWGERPWHQRIMQPEFVHASAKDGVTCESKYVEPARGLDDLIRLGAKIGINAKFLLDHIFISHELAELKRNCRILPDRVSDHYPMELELS